MSLSAKLLDWQAAELIDADTAAQIAAHEARSGRPVAIWAAVGLGLLALGLGIVLIVAAGWDRIPVWTKLSAHLALTGAAAGVAFAAGRRGHIRLAEAALVLLAALTLAGLALHAQVWQLSGPLWELFGWWVLLAAAALLLGGQTRLAAYVLAAMLMLWATAYGQYDLSKAGGPLSPLLLAIAPALILLSLSPAGAASGFRAGLREAGLGLLLFDASAAHVAWAFGVSASDAAAFAPRLPLAAILVVIVAIRADSAALRHAALASLIAPIALLPHDDSVGARAAGAALFMLMWAIVARGAALSGWRGLFGTAVAVIALRLLIVYFELFGGLATTGIGLAGGGALTIALALGWARLVRGRT